jgi:hypothetical protein
MLGFVVDNDTIEIEEDTGGHWVRYNGVAGEK